MNSLIVFALAVTTLLMQDEAVTASSSDDLHDELFVRYDANQHPPNDVRLAYKIYFRECPIPSDSGDLVSTVRETQRWRDERLEWSPSDYDGVDNINVLANEVWTPGVIIDPSIGDEVSSSEAGIRVTSSGVLHRSRELQVSSRCDDTGGAWKCQLRFVSWKNPPRFSMVASRVSQGISDVICPLNIEVEEYSSRVEQVGPHGSINYHYVVDMVIRPH